MLALTCFLVVAVTGSFGAVQLKYDDCNTNKQLLHVDVAHLSPYPVHIPGDLTVSGHGVLGRNLTGNLELQVHISKSTGLFGLYVPVPCVAGFGSCTYDFCKLLHDNFVVNNAESCPPQLTKQHIHCTCPIMAGTYDLQPSQWNIPKLQDLLAWLSSGDYKVDVKLVDKTSRQTVGCYHVAIAFTHPCTGFGCIFG